MHYREVDWLPAYMAYPELVTAFEDLGMRPVGCMILDSGLDGAGQVEHPQGSGAVRPGAVRLGAVLCHVSRLPARRACRC